MPKIDAILSRFNSFDKQISHEDFLLSILETYIDLFPVRDAYLMRYSAIGSLTAGVIAIRNSEALSIGAFRDDIRCFPVIFKAIQEKIVIYTQGKNYIRNMNAKYGIDSTSKELLIVPIYYNSCTFAYICSNTFRDNFKFEDDLKVSLSTFAFYTGKLINEHTSNTNNFILSSRELEVMRRVAEGESSKEIASLFSLSALTVNQYIKNSIKKLDAKNRTEAVIKLYKLGLIV